jgi:hypothetical protein
VQEEFHAETVRKLQALYMYDCLRANKSTMACSVEARVPFLDRDFVQVAMSVDPAEKMIDKSKGVWAVCRGGGRQAAAARCSCIHSRSWEEASLRAGGRQGKLGFLGVVKGGASWE